MANDPQMARATGQAITTEEAEVGTEASTRDRGVIAAIARAFHADRGHEPADLYLGDDVPLDGAVCTCDLDAKRAYDAARAFDPPMPCHHTHVVVVDDHENVYLCDLDDGHDGAHQDDEGRSWRNETCDTDLHYLMRPILTIDEPNAHRSLCAECAAHLFLHTQRRWREAREGQS